MIRPNSPLRRLGWFFAVGVVGFNLLLMALPWTPNRSAAILHTGGFAIGFAEDDSWMPMERAWTQFRKAPDDPFYTEIFFQQHVKFQYPPTSLFVYAALDALHVPAEARTPMLNALAWLAVAATAVVVALVFVASLRAVDPALVASTFDRNAAAILAAAFTLTYYPIVKAFTLGQIQTWLNLAFALLVFAWVRARVGTAGVLAGLMCLVKPQYVLLLPWAVVRGEWRFVGALTAILALAGTASLAEFGLQNHLDYLSVLSYISRHGESFFANATMNGLLHRLLGNGPNEFEAHAYAPYHPVVYAGTLVSSAVLIGLCLFWRRREHASAPVPDLLIAGLTLTMASPIALEHHYGVLMPAFAVMVPAFLRTPPFGRTSLVWLGIAYVLTGNYLRVTQHAAGTALNLVQSYQLFGAIIALVCLYALRSAPAKAGASDRAPAMA